MSTFAVIRDAGAAWTDRIPLTEQPAVGEHTTFMNGLAGEGFVLVGGPLAGTESGRLRVLLIVDADDEAEIRRRLADDPWATTGRLEITSIEPWNVLVGTQRLSIAPRAPTP
jgi:uncharacterized protein YciI